MSILWRASSVTVTNGSALITVQTGDDIAGLKPGSSLYIEGQLLEVKRTYTTDTGVNTIETIESWDAGSGSGKVAKGVLHPGAILALSEQAKQLIEASEALFGSQSVNPTANSIAKRDDGGRVKTNTPSANNDAVNKGYLKGAATRDVGTSGSELPDTTELNKRLGTTGNVIKSISIPGGLSFIPDTLRKQVELSTQGKNTVLYNANGDPSIMMPIYKFRYEDLGFAGDPFGTGVATAFMVNGVEKSEVFIGAFQGYHLNGQVVSLPGLDPRTSVNFDTAKSWCQANGQGWHLMSEHEWAAIALWCMANGFEPRGNTNYGRAHDATHEFGRRQDGGIAGDASGAARILTGSGPDAWRHDNSPFGIADLTGNAWEWSDQLKLVDGRVYCTTDNNFAEDEINWVPQGHYLSNESGNLTLKNSPGVSNEDGLSTDWGALSKEAGYTESQLLQRLLFSPAGITPQGRLYARTGGERLPFRGGSWSSGPRAGLAARSLNFERSTASSGIGFRPAFVA